MQVLTEHEKSTVVKEVENQFKRLLGTLKSMDASAWSAFYSDQDFVSAVAGVDVFESKEAWVAVVSEHFANRKMQDVAPLRKRVTPLALDLALMVSDENSKMMLEDGGVIKSKHAFTMLWKKETAGWKIVHSHESWIDD
jgi:ketosteroid isomerase-like protein